MSATPNAVDILFDAVSRSELVDLTHPLKPGMPVWPGHPEFCQTALESLEGGDASCTHALALGEHTGTHFDAPSHFILGGATIAQVPPERFFGRMATIGATGLAASTAVGADTILAWEERHGPLRQNDAVFLHFGWDRFWDADPAAFLRDWPGLSGAAAALLVARGVRVVGSDCLSLDPFDSTDFAAHRALLGAGILIGENFARLGDLPPVCSLAALPLPIIDGSGSPLRAIAFVPRPV
ncbi:cyclase family protein [Lichenihabitans sp. Uapishka_5]|uniref:cyclase family protein n=1 Tax=Lichenihabitans sp. Uapishka_5 TaxID=3037302 RepID=UPI0029E7FFB6|nr:cyclase family protein [Lichenihabitans sp. Uapishka_5]MDX7950847.1 cyclase family protein [Lichenihabitans sp. Uapishka_5]